MPRAIKLASNGFHMLTKCEIPTKCFDPSPMFGADLVDIW